jgi:hypothetical protein
MKVIKMKINNKKTISPMNIIIAITIFVIIFVLMFVYIAERGTKLGSTQEDLACRAYLKLKSTSAVEASEFLFFNDVRNRCVQDYVDENVDDKNETFNIIADSMQRCWYRYGEGQYDFLNFMKDKGNWCFTCAEIILDNNDENKIYDYKDLVTHLKRSTFEREEEGETTNIAYFDHINIKYTDESVNFNYKSTEDEIKNLYGRSEGDFQIKALLLMLNGQLSHVRDAKNKAINTEENIYVVYRYDKFGDQSQEDIETLGLRGDTYDTVKSGAELFIDYKALRLACRIPIPLACKAGLIWTALKSAERVINYANAVAIRDDINNIYNNLNSVIKYSKSEASQTGLFTYMGKVSDIENIAKGVARSDKDFGDALFELQEALKKLKIEEVEGLKTIEIKEPSEIIDLQIVISKINKNKYLDKIRNNEDASTSSLRELSSLETDMTVFVNLQAEEAIKDQVLMNSVINYIKVVINYASSLSDKNTIEVEDFTQRQYVDVMTEEQYYRVCGTKRPK